MRHSIILFTHLYICVMPGCKRRCRIWVCCILYLLQLVPLMTEWSSVQDTISPNLGKYFPSVLEIHASPGRERGQGQYLGAAYWLVYDLGQWESSNHVLIKCIIISVDMNLISQTDLKSCIELHSIIWKIICTPLFKKKLNVTNILDSRDAYWNAGTRSREWHREDESGSRPR